MSTTTAAGPMPTATANTDAAGYYPYDPSTTTAIVVLAFFFCTTSLHIFQMTWTRTWYWVPFIVGGCLETMGYAARTYNAEKTPDWSRTAYILETLGILISPAFMAASMYMLFGRLIRLCDGDQRSFIKAKWLTAIFVTGDVISLLVQAVGGGEVISTDPDTIRRGEKIIDAGLLVQIASFGTFITSALVFHWRILKHPTDASTNPAHPWQKHLITLYITSCLIFGRCIFRAASYLEGYGGQIAKSEVLFYIFDATFVWIVTVIFNIVHPSEVRALLVGKGRVFWKGRLEQIDFRPYHIDDEIPLHRRDGKARH